MTKEIIIKTLKSNQLINITSKVEKILQESNIIQGVVLIFVPHSTAGIILTEDENGLIQDWENIFNKLITETNFAHNQIDDNARSHLLSGLIGQSRILPIHNKKLMRGFWQDIFLAEFDGPRTRKIMVQIIKTP